MYLCHCGWQGAQLIYQPQSGSAPTGPAGWLQGHCPKCNLVFQGCMTPVRPQVPDPVVELQAVLVVTKRTQP